MSENKSNVPKLRFPEFTDAWEQRKLVDVVDARKGMDYKHLSAGDIPVYGAGGYMLSVNKALSYSKDAIGIGRKGTIDKPYLLRAPFWTVDTLFYAFPRDKNDLDFVHAVFQRIDWKRKDESTGVPSLSKTTINAVDVITPDEAEQKQIGAFFARIDDLIALYQRKLGHLREQKRGLLRKMFPKDGADVPEIRFTEFTDAWEQRKLSEMALSFEYGLHVSAIEYDGENKYLRITDIDDETHEFKTDALTTPDVDLSKAGNYRLQEGDVLFARTGASVGKTYHYKDFDGLVYFASFLIRARIKPEYDSEFVFQNTLTDSYNRYITVTSQRSGQLGVNAREYADYGLSAPKIAEQQKLGDFFANFDHLIALHQRKLKHLQEQKKALLQQMFI
jgi:type I restriction enzyme S subunit